MRFDEVDRIPVASFGLGKLDQNSPIARELITRTDPFIEVHVPGDVYYGAACERESWTEGDITTTAIHTPLGNLTQRVRTTPITSGVIEFPIKTPEDVERYLSINYVKPEVDATPFHRRKAEIGQEGLVLAGIPTPVCLPATMLSPETFCLWWEDHPELLLMLTTLFSARVNDWVDRLCKAGVDGFRLIGGEYASVQLGPSGFDALALEQDSELVDIIHRCNGIAYYHNHGPVMRFVERFARIGMDALDPLEAPPWGDADLKRARELCGSRVAFVGNIDDMEILEKLPFEQIEPIARQRIESGGDRGFILGGTASGSWTEKAARNFMRLVDVAESYS